MIFYDYNKETNHQGRPEGGIGVRMGKRAFQLTVALHKDHGRVREFALFQEIKGTSEKQSSKI